MKKLLPILTILGAVAFASAPARAQLLVNGGFENGASPWVFTGSAQLGAGSTFAQAGTGYAIVSSPFVDVTPSAVSLNSVTPNAVVAATGTVSQTISTTVGQNYLIQYYAATFGNGPGDSVTAQFGNSAPVAATNLGSSFDGGQAPYYALNSFTEVASSTSTTLTFTGTSGISTYDNGPDYVCIDTVSVENAAPELDATGWKVPIAAGVIGCLILLP